MHSLLINSDLHCYLKTPPKHALLFKTQTDSLKLQMAWSSKWLLIVGYTAI